MKKLHLTALLLGAALFTGMGASSLSAEGKCGTAMEKPNGKCGASKKTTKCGDDRRAATKCGDDRNPAKCGKDLKSSKCGDDRRAPAKSMKCGQGKCG